MAQRFICSLPNPDAKANQGADLAVRECFYPDDDTGLARAAAFAQQENKPGRGVYDCIGVLRDGVQRRCKENVEELHKLVSDLDLRNIVETREKAVDTLRKLALTPTEISDSGHGLHAKWELKEGVCDAAGLDQAEQIMKRLAQLLAGDPAPTHRAALLRRPGTDNTKFGECHPCHTIERSGQVYDIGEFEDLFDLYGDRPLLTRKGGETNGGNGGAETDESIDLGAMEYGRNINRMLWRYVGSELCKGTPANDVVRTALEALEQNPKCQGDPNKAKWPSTLADMIERTIRGNPALLTSLETDEQKGWHGVLQEGKTPKILWRRDYRKLQVRGFHYKNDAAPDGEPEEQKTRNEQTRRAELLITARPFQPFDVAALPPREWLYGKHYQKGVTTATIGAGGGGKSSLGLIEQMAMCTGRNLLGEQPLERCRAWFHNAEESIVELQRRVAAVCQHYEIPQQDLVGWLFLTSGIEMPIKIGTSRGGRLCLDAGATDAIIRTILDNDIGSACFDPLIAHHTAAENITGDMDQICREFARIANVTNCAIEFVHHTRKPAPGQEELSVADSRGAGAIKDAVRSMRVLNTMAKTEADKLGIDDVDRRLHFRVDNGKANMAPPSAARWYKLVSADLPNGDSVGVVTGWAYPEAQTAEVPDAVCVQIQQEVAKSEYRAAPQSHSWVGRLVARTMRIDLNAKAGKAAANRLLATLYNKGVITVADGSAGGHKVSVVAPGPWTAQQPEVGNLGGDANV